MVNRELKSLRALHGYTQKDLADKLDIGETSYTRRENGVTDFSQSEIFKIKKLFGLDECKLVEIFFNSELR